MTNGKGRATPARRTSSVRDPGGPGKKKLTFVARVAGFWPLAVIPGAAVSIWLRGPVPGLVLAFMFNSLLTILFYREDKRLAERQEWRIPEASLHFWELFCGWPGALFAQACFRHKWKKLSYMIVFWLCVILNAAAVAWLVFPEQMKRLVEAGIGQM